MMAVMKKPKAKEDGTVSKARMKRPSAKPSKKEALRKMVAAALRSGTATPELLAAVRKKWPELVPESPQAKPASRKRTAAQEEEEEEKERVPKKRKTGAVERKGAPQKNRAKGGQERGKKKEQKEEDEEDLSGLSKREIKVKGILKKTVKPEKLSRKERRALQLARRKDGGLVKQLLQQWEELRAGSCDAERRTELCAAIIEATKGKIRDLVMAHDTSRVFESVMKHGSMEQRLTVLEELKNDVPLLMKTKFAKFVVKKMLLYGGREHKNLVFAAFEGAVMKMVVHRQAVEVLDSAFNDYANAAQRANLVQELYGPPFSLFKVSGATKLSEAFAGDPKANRENVLKHIKDILTQAISKGNVRFYILHYLLCDFFDNCSQSDLTEIAQLLKEQLIPLLHTREGVKVAMRCLWAANNKDRKVILKSMKTFFTNTAVDEHGYLFILALFDAVDDIVFLKKTLIKELLEDPGTLFESQYGRKVMLYMLDRRNPCHFHPQLLDILQKGDDNPFTKKAADVRSKELREGCIPALLRFSAANMPAVCGSNGGLVVLRELLRVAPASDLLTCCVRATVQCLASGEKVCEDKESLVESAAGHMALKKALQADKDAGGVISAIFLQELTTDAIEAISACNRGCFLLVHLCEASPDAVAALQATPGLASSLSHRTFAGAKILAKKLA